MMYMYIVSKSVYTNFFSFCTSLILLMQYTYLRDGIVEWLGRLAVVWKVTGSSPARAQTGKLLLSTRQWMGT